MFESLSERLQGVFRNLSRHATLHPAEVDNALREIRLALLEADVHYQVVKDLLANVREQALSEEVARALNPSQQVIRALQTGLLAVLGEPGRLTLKGPAPRVIMLVGLQGSGKTTTAAKLGRHLRSGGERVWLVAADPYRPAAAEQLSVLGREIDVPVFAEAGEGPPEVCVKAVAAASRAGASVVILDTAGRSQLDERLMAELRVIRERVHPAEVLLVADAMTGQEAVAIAQGFTEGLGLTGLILTKMDGDARGGAAISMRAVTGVPITFIGTGEAREALEAFQPERLASRILGMGDVLGLIEKAEAALDGKEAEEQARRVAQGEFTLDDLAAQLNQVRGMGSLGAILDMLPAGLLPAAPQVDSLAAERQLRRTQAILGSMTPLERRRPETLNASRKRRIAAGSGTTVQEVNQLLRQHQQMRRLFQKVGRRGVGDMRSLLR
jgi:signal recognition particle subunit SRP54